MELKDYKMQRCARCNGSYMEYWRKDSRCTWRKSSELSTIPVKGLCAFCNPYSYCNAKLSKEEQDRLKEEIKKLCNFDWMICLNYEL